MKRAREFRDEEEDEEDKEAEEPPRFTPLIGQMHERLGRVIAATSTLGIREGQSGIHDGLQLPGDEYYDGGYIRERDTGLLAPDQRTKAPYNRREQDMEDDAMEIKEENQDFQFMDACRAMNGRPTELYYDDTGAMKAARAVARHTADEALRRKMAEQGIGRVAEDLRLAREEVWDHPSSAT